MTMATDSAQPLLVGALSRAGRNSCQILVMLLALLLSHTAISQTVYITRTGEKYHDDGCRYLSKSQIKTTLNEAKENGYTACSVCKPAIKSSTIKQRLTTPSSSSPKATSTQCTARTKSNTRCSRTTTNASGKCWQHE